MAGAACWPSRGRVPDAHRARCVRHVQSARHVRHDLAFRAFTSARRHVVHRARHAHRVGHGPGAHRARRGHHVVRDHRVRHVHRARHGPGHAPSPRPSPRWPRFATAVAACLGVSGRLGRLCHQAAAGRAPNRPFSQAMKSASSHGLRGGDRTCRSSLRGAGRARGGAPTPAPARRALMPLTAASWRGRASSFLRLL